MAYGGGRRLPAAAADIVKSADWEAHVRDKWRDLQGPVCIFELDDVNIRDFCQGDIYLVEQDLLPVVPRDVALDVLQLLKAEGLENAYHVRKEMVNFKKVCLNVYQEADKLEKDIRQMCSFFHSSDAVLSESGDYHIHSARYTELCQTRNACKGALGVVADVRRITKAVCCVPRFPRSGVPSMLVEAPYCMTAWRDVERATYFIEHGVKGWEGRLVGQTRAVSLDSTQPQAISHAEEGVAGRCASVATETKRLNTVFEKLCVSMQSWGYPAHVIDYIKLVLIARGAAKALWIVDESRLLHKALLKAVAEVDAVKVRLVTLPRAGDIVEELKACSSAAEAEGVRRRKREELMEAVHGQRFQALVRGMSSILHDVTRWVGEISVSHVNSKKLFLAGDRDRAHGTTMFTPDGFQMIPVFEAFRGVCDKYRPHMYAVMQQDGWPPPAGAFRTKMLNGETQCRVCRAKYASLWIHRGICWVCEESERNAGRCPHRAACNPAAFCPHRKQCFLCSAASCEECCFFYADGEDVQCLVERFKPVAIYLDFDRTLCTTRGGGSPLVGNHSLDPGLLSVLSCAPETATVVTRNSYRDDIKKFMEMKGLGRAKIFTTRKHQSKADAMIDASELGPEECILFVDDTIAELIDPRLTEKYERGQLKRVLFSRARI